MISLDEKSRDIEEELIFNEELLDNLQATLMFYQTASLEENEREECWKMRLEDIRVTLYEVTSQTLCLRNESLRLQEIYSKLPNENEKNEIYQSRILKCMGILNKVIIAFNQEKESADINQLFCEVLIRLQDSSLNALDSYCTYEVETLQDPREMMPYRRSADHVPGKTPRVSQLRNKARVNVTTSP